MMFEEEEYDEQLELLRRVHEAFRNSYEVVINKQDPYKFIAKVGDVVFVHDIQKDLTIEQVQHMISYWEDFEEYEKCHEVKKLENEIAGLSTENQTSSTKNITHV